MFESIHDHVSREKQKARKLKNSRWWSDLKSRGVCHYCEGCFDAAEITMDHVIPLSRWGHSDKNNIVPSCKACNTQKSNQIKLDII